MAIRPSGRENLHWSRWRGKARNDIQEIFRINKVGDRWSNKRTEKYKWLCHKMNNTGANIKIEKWDWIHSHQIQTGYTHIRYRLDTLTSDVDWIHSHQK